MLPFLSPKKDIFVIYLNSNYAFVHIQHFSFCGQAFSLQYQASNLRFIRRYNEGPGEGLKGQQSEE